MRRAGLAAIVLWWALLIGGSGAAAQDSDTGPWVKTCTHPDACMLAAIALDQGEVVIGLYLFTEEVRYGRGPIVNVSLVSLAPGNGVVRAADFTVFDGERICALNEEQQCILERKMNGGEFARLIEAETITVDDGAFSASFPVAGLLAAYRGATLTDEEAQARVFRTAVEARPHAEAPLALLHNEDPEAFTAGIRFHSSLSVDRRRLLLEDLAYLAALGPLKDSDLLAAMIGVPPGELTGRTLATWVIQSLPVISGPDFCHVGAVFRPEADGRLVPVSVRNVTDCAEKVEWLAFTSTYPRASARGALLVNEEFATVPEGQAGLRVLSIVSMPTGRTAASRVRRLDLLIHEAFHSRLLAGHVACASESRLFGTVDMSVHDFSFPAPAECDPASEAYRGAYAAGAEANRILLGQCQDCSDADRMQIAFDQMGSWMVTGIKASRPLTIPDEGILAGTGFAGRSFEVVPPLRFFEAAREGIAAGLEGCGTMCGTGWAADFEATQEALDAIEAFLRSAEDALPESWATPSIGAPVEPPALDPEEAEAWLAAALEAEATGYNLPLATQIPCRQLSDRCAEILAAYRGVPVDGPIAPWTGDPLVAALFRDGRAALEGLDARGKAFSADEVAMLDTMVRALLINSDWRIVVEAAGPAGNRAGGAAQFQAERVRSYLVEHGIDGARITALALAAAAGGKPSAAEQATGVAVRLDFTGLDLSGLTPQQGALVD